jgi:hypothetical protein
VKKWDQVITLLEASDLMEEEEEGDPSSPTGYYSLSVDKLCSVPLPCIRLTNAMCHDNRKLIVALGNAAGVYEQLKDYEEAESVLTVKRPPSCPLP